jgi:hypothetical protein
MSEKIRFEVVRSGVNIPLTSHDIAFLDEVDCIEKQILIGSAIELDGTNYEVINQVAEPVAGKGIVYYLQEGS